MQDYSIEYAHIYTNESPEKEHNACIEILKDIHHELKGNSISLVVMVDDYSFPDPSFDYDVFVHGLEKNGQSPNILIRESSLIPYCDITLKSMSGKIERKKIEDYIISAKKYPCSLFIATWYLIRLGCIECIFFPHDHTAGTLINILPQSFSPFEDRALEIIANTPFSMYCDKIENRYFEGRIII